ncbi:MAG: cupin domain-containing protein [Gammaproteobacteria bacterium]|nr:cupin domain-containing protein [Gammaproteobacteria bacterium]
MRRDTDLVEYWLEQLEPGDRAHVEDSISNSNGDRGLALETQQALVDFGDTVTPLPPARGLRDRILASLEDSGRFRAHVDRLGAFLDLPSDRVQELLQTAESATRDAPGWQATGLPGLLALPIQGGPNIANTQAQLLHLDPGFNFPAHRHQGHEWGYVLQGLLQEDSGRLFASGDIVHKPAGSSHRFKVESECPALLFVLLEGPIQWLDN